MLDVCIRSGTVVDGTGQAGTRADVAIAGGRIVAVEERIDEPARQTIDAEGRLVIPGFVDLHTHYDIQAFWDPTLSPSPLHGVTTVIGGNCGFSVAPLEGSEADYLMHMLARVEGMPIETLQAACAWDWTSFGSYLDRLEGTLAPNAGFLVGHSAIRRVTMGAAAGERAATDDELTSMQALLARSLAEGGLGFSSSWAATHNDFDGDPVPSRLATEAELLALCETVGSHPGTTLEFIPGVGQFTDVEADVMGRMSARADRPLNWNVLIVMAGLEAQAAEQLAASDRAAALGGRVLGLTMPAPVMPRLSFASGFLLDTIPGWRDAMTCPVDERAAILASPEQRTALMASAGDAAFGLANFGQYVLSECRSPETRRWEGRTVDEVAREMGATPFDALCEVALADDLRTGFSFPPNGDTRRDWEARLDVWRDPRSVIGASDAGAHLDFLATFGFPTTMIRRAVVDLELLDWPEAIALLTDRPARLYGLRDRGRLEVGCCADVVVLDPDRIAPEPIVSRTDLPGGGWRLYGEATGIDHVLVNGVEIVTDGVMTDARPGTVLRSARHTSTVHARAAT
ncbi:MAG TPA: amidohydrolase family protein [Microthrixaceae bacterium]|nr:amidohydrolase family protein [Microthrixaceae bacterium]